MKTELMTQGTQIQELLGLKLPAVAIAFRDTPPAGIPRVTSPTAAGCGYWKLAAEGQVFYTEARARSDFLGLGRLVPIDAIDH